MPTLKRELAEFMQEYNAHNICKQKDRLCPPGNPEDDYRFPERLGIYKHRLIQLIQSNCDTGRFHIRLLI